jgi:uncharacterized protein YdhG (YjbR/CyaY superfamily)
VFNTKAATVKEYLAALPEERRKTLSKVRAVIKKHLPKGYKETLSWGAITYEIPLKQFPDTYNGQPLCYAALAAQKNHNALYLMCAYGDPTQRKLLEDAFAKAGKKLDMGKACVRFKDTDDLPLAAIGKLIASVPPAKYIEAYRSSRKKK